MNSEEAIQYFNDEIRLCKAAPSINGCQMTENWQRTIDACEIAVAAIRKVSTLDMAQGERDVVTKRMIELEQENVTNRNGLNEPLTLDELREMDGEPVWVVYGEDEGMWALVEICEESIFLTNNLGGRTEYADDAELEDDGLTVYRKKPEEGTE